jgi:hypothetical protein
MFFGMSGRSRVPEDVVGEVWYPELLEDSRGVPEKFIMYSNYI